MKATVLPDSEVTPIKNERYLPQNRLGGGGFCEVVQALDTETSKLVAIKILDKSKPIFQKGREEVVDKKLRTLMRREANIMKEMDHPNILQFYDIYEDKTECFLVVELVNGGELYDKIARDTKVPELAAIQIVKQLLEAVKYMHDHGFVHRDIKPENILFQISDNVSVLKLADLGLSRKIETLMFTNCGTIDYCAPELLLNRIERKGYGKEVDIWSIGVVVFVTLSGYQPFMTTTQNEEDLKVEIICGHYKFHKTHWKNISSNAINFISSILKTEPKRRALLSNLINHDWLQDGQTT